MSKVIQRLKPEDRVTTRVAATEVPLHLCLETHADINDVTCYQENAAVMVGDVLLVKDAP